jgi:hypothetical protein
MQNLAASVNARLLKRAELDNEDFQFLELPVIAASKRESLKSAWVKGGPWKSL